MKKVRLVSCMAALMMSQCVATGLAENSLLDEYAQNPYAFKSLAIGAFSTDAASAPSDEELTTMLRFAMASSSAHGLTPAHFVVVRDPQEQINIVSGVAAFGEPIPASEGTVTILILGDAVRDQEVHEADYNGWYSQMYYGIYDAGAAAAYLTLAAQSMGYSVHQVAGLNIPLKESGEVNVFGAGGNFELVNGEYWDVSKYLTSQDGKVDFTHTVGNATMDGQRMDVKAEGNLTLLSTIVIGKPADGVDAVSSTTTVTENLENYNFWDPQDSVSYGNAVAAGEKLTAQESGASSLSDVADGIYTGHAQSTSSEYTVQVEMKDGAIADIKVIEGLENMFAGEEKVNAYIAEILETQKIDADVISGATMDCKGISDAIKEALNQ